LTYVPPIRYLSCDKHGLLSATSSAVSALESFVIVPSPGSPGLFSLQICAGDVEAYLTIKEAAGKTGSGAVEIRGDADTISFATSFRVRMQARFKPKLKAFKESKALEKISRKELEAMVGRKLEDDEVKRLKRARREGSFHEELLYVRVKSKHDKHA
jgi:protein FRG1